ncbi:DNA recombination protein RmuC [Corynebacterium uterequi]|uniref:RmuC family n=1 Tax=Corynebacterium uterequi TaxID=1072256 RepID=A0A0G3HBX5_9CORY|nr:DNA recombination protein RmuC [Corynebacterium uterequi]AKK10799.1 RmuC family [Corynebacterium uterequi]
MASLVVTLVIGLLIGVVLGWLARGQQPEQSTPVGAGQPQLPGGLSEDRFVEQMAPLRSAVSQLGLQLQALETDRAAALSSLTAQMQAVTRTSTRLNDRTDKLVTALRAPQIRGRWGEMQLQRVVELGGMLQHCDFSTQVSVRVGEQVLRPDLVVHLTGGRQIIVDAKVPFSAYLDAMDTQSPEEQAAFMRRHAHLLRTHVTQLASKSYQDAFSPTPEFVVCFVPADPFLDAALSVEPELLDYAMGRNVVIATPTSLFALLRTVALSWQHEDVSERARTIQRLGRELYQRLYTFHDHYAKVGRQLEKTVSAYNSTLGSLDSRVMVTARRLSELEVTANRHEADTIEPISTYPRSQSAFGDEGNQHDWSTR